MVKSQDHFNKCLTIVSAHLISVGKISPVTISNPKIFLCHMGNIYGCPCIDVKMKYVKVTTNVD